MEYNIQKADLERDAQTIIGFWKDNFPLWPVEKFVWFYLENVYGPADCWVIREAEEGTMVGSTAIFPRRFFFEGNPVLAGIAGDFGVDKGHRILGPALKLQKTVAEFVRNGKYAFIYGYPNIHSEPVTKRAGYQVVGNSIRLARVIKTRKYLSRSIPIPMLAGLTAQVADWGFRLYAQESRRRLPRGYKAELLPKTDERFDTLWQKALNHYRLIGERSHDFLTWRFVKCPFRQYHIFALHRKEDDLLSGYVIYYRDKDFVNIADILAESPSVMRDLLLPAFLKFIRNEQCDSISVIYFGQEELPDNLRRFHFSPREGDRNIVALIGADEEIKRVVSNQADWYFLEADND